MSRLRELLQASVNATKKGLSSASLKITESENGPSSTGTVPVQNLYIFGGFIDLDSYDTIAMKLKGDGRCNISTIYTENWVNSPAQQEDNSWQAFVFGPKDNWYIAKTEMNPSRIVDKFLSVNAEGGVPGARIGPGDFRVEHDWIKSLRTQ